MEKLNQLQENRSGNRFYSNGELFHRANSGWRGTPPIVTSDYEGTWEKDGNILTLTTPFWGGTQIQEWKITTRSGNTLHVKAINS